MAEELFGRSGAKYPELEIRISPELGRVCRVDMGFTQAGSSAPTEWSGRAMFDPDDLGQANNDIVEYGRRLTRALFQDESLRDGFNLAIGLAASQQLRLRLYIDTELPQLHSLRWEALRTPDDMVIATGDRILFSRYLRSADWRRVSMVREQEARALVLIANPSNLTSFSPEGSQLEPIDVDKELAQARQALGAIPQTVFAGPGKASVANLINGIRNGCNVLYIVCHGAYVDGQARLYLESEAGSVVTVTGNELAREFAQLRQLPSLVVLASCQSAGSASGGALASVGPLLARVGVPAVLAMQERISMRTSSEFVTTFFTELTRDGRLDRAAAVARSRVKLEPDFWVPVLFSRLSDACLWKTASQVVGDFELWPGIVSQIQKGSCTPIIGPGLLEFLLGPTREMAQHWADTYHFPMSPHDREDLPQVAQFLGVTLGSEFPADELARYIQREIVQRYESPPELPADGRPDLALHELISHVGRRERERKGDADPYRILAQLPFPIFVTANPDSLLYDALKEADKDPVVEVSYWSEGADPQESVFVKNPDYTPSVERPLIYHMFGQMSDSQSLVLTEDNFFDFLLGLKQADWQIPAPVTAAWNKSALLFIGFEMEDWTFRVLFRTVISQPGAKLRWKKPNVAVQLDPDEGNADPLRAKAYLEDYLKGEQIKTYWGSADGFLNELWTAWLAAGGSSQPRAKLVSSTAAAG